MTLGLAAGFIRAGLVVRGTEAPAVSPGPRGGTETTCVHANPHILLCCCCLIQVFCYMPSFSHLGLIHFHPGCHITG